MCNFCHLCNFRFEAVSYLAVRTGTKGFGRETRIVKVCLFFWINKDARLFQLQQKSAVNRGPQILLGATLVLDSCDLNMSWEDNFVENTLQMNINFKTTIDSSNFLAQNCMKLSTEWLHLFYVVGMANSNYLATQSRRSRDTNLGGDPVFADPCLKVLDNRGNPAFESYDYVKKRSPYSWIALIIIVTS